MSELSSFNEFLEAVRDTDPGFSKSAPQEQKAGQEKKLHRCKAVPDRELLKRVEASSQDFAPREEVTGQIGRKTEKASDSSRQDSKETAKSGIGSKFLGLLKDIRSRSQDRNISEEQCEQELGGIVPKKAIVNEADSTTEEEYESEEVEDKLLAKTSPESIDDYPNHLEVPECKADQHILEKVEPTIQASAEKHRPLGETLHSKVDEESLNVAGDVDIEYVENSPRQLQRETSGDKICGVSPEKMNREYRISIEESPPPLKKEDKIGRKCLEMAKPKDYKSLEYPQQSQKNDKVCGRTLEMAWGHRCAEGAPQGSQKSPEESAKESQIVGKNVDNFLEICKHKGHRSAEDVLLKDKTGEKLLCYGENKNSEFNEDHEQKVSPEYQPLLGCPHTEHGHISKLQAVELEKTSPSD